nr:hypothetical protein [Tanacetum cinerariifolium]
MGSQLRLRFKQEAKLLRKSVAQVARRDKKIQARELEIKNLEALLEAEANTKKAAKDRSAGLSQELENMRARFLDLQSLRRDHADPRPSGSSCEGKSLAAIQLGLASTVFVPEDAPAGVSDPDSLSVADPLSRHLADVA